MTIAEIAARIEFMTRRFEAFLCHGLSRSDFIVELNPGVVDSFKLVQAEVKARSPVNKISHLGEAVRRENAPPCRPLPRRARSSIRPPDGRKGVETRHLPITQLSVRSGSRRCS